MSKETMHNSEANIEVRKLKDELRDDELDVVTGGIIPGESTDMGHKDWVDTSDPTARRPLGTSCYVGWISTKHVTVK